MNDLFEGLRVEAISHSFEQAGAGRFSRRVTTRPVLKHVSFAVGPGTMTALVGPSGCGKSTLLRILAGLIAPDQGQARINEQNLMGRPGGVVYHPQRDALLPWLRALDNATLGAETYGLNREAVRDEALQLLERFGLEGHENAWPDELSGGMRQRVALMRSFLTPQQALVLDEPLGALDALTRRQLQHWLLDITASDRRPTLLVTHDIEESLLLADRVLVFSDRPGRILHVEERPDIASRKRQHEDGGNRSAVNRILEVLNYSETKKP